MTTEDRGTVLNQVWRNHNPNQSKQVIGEKMNRFLYHKYGSSQIYYFTKELNDILTDVHSPASIISKDLIQFADNQERLRRFYKINEYPGKIQLLSEFFKFHSDLPKIFMMPFTQVLFKFHNKKRRINFIKVTRMLRNQHNAELDLESDSESSNFQDSDDNDSRSIMPEYILPRSLIHSLYIREVYAPEHKLDKKADQSSRSLRDLQGVLTKVFRTPIADPGDLSFSQSMSRVEEVSSNALREAFGEKGQHKRGCNVGLIVLRDSILMKKKKSPNQLNVQDMRIERPMEPLKVQFGPSAKEDKEIKDKEVKLFQKSIKHKTFEPVKPIEPLGPKLLQLAQPQTTLSKKSTVCIYPPQNVTDLKLRPNASPSKEKKVPVNLINEDSVNKLKKSYQNLNINININFNDRKKDSLLPGNNPKTTQNALLDKDPQKKGEEAKKDYPKLNLFNLISKNKKGLGESEDQHVVARPNGRIVEQKGSSSTELAKMFNKKFSEPGNSHKVVFANKVSHSKGPKHVQEQEESSEPMYKDNLLPRKKHSMSSSVNSIQQAMLKLGKNRLGIYNSADRNDSASKQPIDIFEKKRKASMVSNNHLTKSKKDLRASLKGPKITTQRHQNSNTKIEPKSSRNKGGGLNKSSKKNVRKLFMSQDFKENPLLVAANLFDHKSKPSGHLFHAPQPGLVSVQTKVPLFGPKRSLAKDSTAGEILGNLTYRSKRSSNKQSSIHGGASDQDLIGQRKHRDSEIFRMSSLNVQLIPDQTKPIPKKKRGDVASTTKHNRVRSEVKQQNYH